MRDDEVLLKDGLHRRVWRDADGERVCKRFRSRGAWRRLGDGRRARREAGMLARLAALGLPVPEVLAVERDADGWVLVTRAIAGAASLEDLARDPSPDVDWHAVGALVGGWHAAGALHGDLHPGNLLRGADGAWRAIDVAAARVADRVPAEARRRELVGLVAALRERVAAADLEALHAGWRAALLPAPPSERAADLDPDGTAAKDTSSRTDDSWPDVREAARRARHASVLAHADRWTRESSRVRRATVGGRAWCLARDDDAIEGDLRALAMAARPGGGQDVVAEIVSGADAARSWAAVTRAHEHGVPVPAPRAFAPREGIAVFAACDAVAWDDVDEAERRALLDLLDDRGLASSAPPRVARTTDGTLALAPDDERPAGFSARSGGDERAHG